MFILAGAAVNNRVDWRTQPITRAPQTRRVEQFPGIAARIVAVGPLMPAGVIVEGFVEASASAHADALIALDAAIAFLNLHRADTVATTIVVNGVTWANVHLADLAVVGDIEAVAAAPGTFTVRRRVRLTWEGLA